MPIQRECCPPLILIAADMSIDVCGSCCDTWCGLGDYVGRVGWSLGFMTLVLAVLVSPFTMGLYLVVGGVDWPAVADVGQAFSMSSAILSGLALVGVAVTMRYQAMQTRVAQLEAIRTRHFELSKMVMDDPDKYGKYWGYGPEDAGLVVRDGYLNQVLNYTKAGFELKVHSAGSVQLIAAELFATAPGRRYWAVKREGWRRSSRSRLERRFFAIVDAAYVDGQ